MGLISRKPAVLLLEDGSFFKGNSLGKIGSAIVSDNFVVAPCCLISNFYLLFFRNNFSNFL